ncbi:hypothetical protein, partial [Brytella acorum]
LGRTDTPELQDAPVCRLSRHGTIGNRPLVPTHSAGRPVAMLKDHPFIGRRNAMLPRDRP